MKNIFSEKLESLKKEVIEGYKDFFRNDNAVCDLRLTNTVASTVNENVEIVGVYVEKPNVSLIGENSNDGNEFFEPVENCNVEDLVYVLEQLHSKQYDIY